MSGKGGNLSLAERYSVKVCVVCNSAIAVPRTPLIERVVVGSNADAADDWIAERVSRGAIIITADVRSRIAA